MSPGFWDDNKRATEILKNIKLNEYWLNLFLSTESAVEDFAVLFDFWKEEEAKEEDVPDIGEMKVEEDTKDDETLLKEKEIEGKRDFIITKLIFRISAMVAARVLTLLQHQTMVPIQSTILIWVWQVPHTTTQVSMHSPVSILMMVTSY